MKVKEESEKVGLKLSIFKKRRSWHPVPSLHGKQIGETMETVTDFILGGSRITADGDYSHEIKRHISWNESYDQARQHIKKQRHYFPKKGLLVKALLFPVVMYRCESWTIKKAERRRIDAF